MCLRREVSPRSIAAVDQAEHDERMQPGDVARVGSGSNPGEEGRTAARRRARRRVGPLTSIFVTLLATSATIPACVGDDLGPASPSTLDAATETGIRPG